MTAILRAGLISALLFIVLLPWPALADPEPLLVKIQAINDLHGGIDTGRRVNNRPAGGAAYLVAAMKQRAGAHPHVLRVGAGDLVGASPAISALLQDEPTVRILNSLGLLVNALGNHEFDEGLPELQRLSNGGCHPVTGCFEGAGYKQISANIFVEATGEPFVPPYHVEYVEGVPIAFIGATTTETPRIVAAGMVDGLRFTDPVAVINRSVAELQGQGVHAFVVLIHDGGDLRLNNGQVGGPFIQIVEGLDPDVDVVVSGHTHQGYTARVGGRLVTQANSYGTRFADIDLTIDRQTNDVTASWADLITAYNDAFTPDPQIEAIVADAQARVGPLTTREVTTLARPLTADQSRAGESALGNLIADAHRWKTGAQIGMTNPGGIRAPLPAGPITWGQLFAVQPFGNELVTMDLSGYQIRSIFELQWSAQRDGSERYRPLQVSGLRVVWDATRPLGERIIELTLGDGTPLESNTQYRVTTNSFTAGGGDGFWIFNDGSNRAYGVSDIAALVEYVEQLPRPVDSVVEGRIQRRD